MNKKFAMGGLLMCILLICTKIYTYPVGLIEIKLYNTTVFLIIDNHVPGGKGAGKIPFQDYIDESNNVLLKWIEQQSKSDGKTLILLEENPDRYNVYHKQDTLPFLCQHATKLSCNSVELKFADRREKAIKTSQILFYEVIQKIVFDLTQGGSLKEKEEDLDNKGTQYRSNFFTYAFPGLKVKFIYLLEMLEQYKVLNSITVEEYIANLTAVRKEIAKTCDDKNYDKDSVLKQYKKTLVLAEVALRNFFNKYSLSPKHPYYTAFFNSMEKEESFNPYLDLYHKYIVPTLLFDVPNAGFYIDITNAIMQPSNTKTVVLYAGALHIIKLKENLIETYKDNALVTQEIGFTTEEQLMSAPAGLCDALKPDVLKKALAQ